MTRKKPVGWRREHARHVAAGKGIPTTPPFSNYHVAKRPMLGDFERFEGLFEAAREDQFMFDFDGGIKGTFVEVWTTPIGTREFQFEPEHNTAYRKEVGKLGDDWDLYISDSEYLLKLAKQYAPI